jgi:Flp pilus assembly protein TadD
MLSRRRPVHTESEPRVVALVRRARRHTLRGETRQAMLATREACFTCADDARLWALYGAACRRARRHDEAKNAIRQAIFLRERERDQRRAVSLQRLLVHLE